MSAYIFYIKQNDRLPKLLVQLFNADGTPLDLSQAQIVRFTMSKNNSIKINLQECQVLDAPNGTISYTWQDGDTDTLGTFKGEFEITWDTNITQTLPEDDYVKIIVKDDLA